MSTSNATVEGLTGSPSFDELMTWSAGSRRVGYIEGLHTIGHTTATRTCNSRTREANVQGQMRRR